MWTEHAVPLKAKDFSWAKGEAWASQVIEHEGKFVLVRNGGAWRRFPVSPSV